MRAKTKFLFAAGPILAAALGFATLGQAAPLAAGAVTAQIAHESTEARAEKVHYTRYRHHHYRHHYHRHHHYHHHRR